MPDAHSKKQHAAVTSLAVPQPNSDRCGRASERKSGNMRTEERQQTVYALRHKRLQPSRFDPGSFGCSLTL